MGVVIGVPATSDEAETRVPLAADVTTRLAGLGARLLVQRGATDRALLAPEALGDVDWADTPDAVVAASDIVWSVGPLAADVEARLRPGQVLVGLLRPWTDADRVHRLAAGGVTAFALELLPRISRAQSMDVLSSQAAIAGYQAVLIAAARLPRFFPMLTYAAGTIRPSRVLVIGAGVAGLQAIATAKRLGAIVEGYDVRPETREQVESLGARFLDTGVSAAGSGGYARELTEAERAQQATALARAVAAADVLITTASVPGRRAPVIVTRAMVEAMRPGSVVVDLAAEGGGNVEGTAAGREVRVGGARVVGALNLPARMPVHASEMLARNLYHFTAPLLVEGEVRVDLDDEVVAGTALTRGGRIVHEGVARALGPVAPAAPVAPPFGTAPTTADDGEPRA